MSHGSTGSGSGPTILVVDDDAGVATLIQRVASSAGFRVLAAKAASDAMELAKSEPLDLIISDVHMPGLTGPDLLTQLQANGTNCPVLFISGNLELSTVDRSLQVRGAAFLPKPFTHAELLEAIRTTIRQR